MSLNLDQICGKFSKSQIKSITELGNGLINDTYRIETDAESFVLQRLNAQVFPQPELVMENLRILNQHLKENSNDQAVLKIPLLRYTVDNDTFYKDKQCHYWRALEFIDDSQSRESISRITEARQVGFTLGYFHKMLINLHVGSLHDSLPGFHITPHYYQYYLRVENACYEKEYSEEINFCRKFIEGFKTNIHQLEKARKKGLVKERIIHGDPKLNNFLFKNNSDEIISLIDLDTVKPGLLQYDIGDCLRSCCHVSGTNRFDLNLCKAILKSYLAQTHNFFTCQDYQFLYPAIQLIPFELGLRFFTDYLEGNRYFKVEIPEQNLLKAISQFQLCKSIESQKSEILAIIEDSMQ